MPSVIAEDLAAEGRDMIAGEDLVGAAFADEERGAGADTLERPPERRRQGGYFARKTGRRLTREEIVRRASFLRAEPRALLTAHFELGMSTEELAALHKISRDQLRRRLAHWCDTLADATFPLAVRFADRLPRGLAAVAREFFLEGGTMREIAGARGISLHELRQRIDRARSLLLLAMAQEQPVPGDVAERLLGGVLNSER